MNIKKHLKWSAVSGVAFFVLFETELSARDYSSSANSVSQNLIFVEESTEIVLPVQNFEVKLWYRIQKESFQGACKESNRVFEALEKEVKSLGLSQVTVIKGWGLPKRTKNSFSTKGKTISTTITVIVRNCPKDIFHLMLAQVIEKSLAMDESMVIEEVRVFPNEKFKLEKQKAVEKLIKTLNKHSDNIARSLGKKIVSAKRLYVFTRNPSNPEPETDGNWGSWTQEEEGNWSEAEVTLQKKIALNQSLKFKAEIVDHIKLLITVKGVYEIN